MTKTIQEIASDLAKNGKGILASDESTATITKRFQSISLESTEETRLQYRQMLFSAKEAMTSYISGVILYDETIRQKMDNGKYLVDLILEAGSIPGIKVDTGAKSLASFPGETITEGLDGLRERLCEYYKIGARFAKWRAVINIDRDTLPTYGAIRQNAQALARYAALCQETNIVPIVEPEVLMDGTPATHSISRCHEVTEKVLSIVFDELRLARVQLNGMILKPNMIVSGKNTLQAPIRDVANRTISCLKNTVPPSVPGIAFLSGGQSDKTATEHLKAINAVGNLPWAVTFSFGRALQAEALKVWNGKEENIEAAQKVFTHHAKMNSLAAQKKVFTD